MLDYVLAVVALSYGLGCLAKALTNPFILSREIKQKAQDLYDEAGSAHDKVRRLVEGIWFFLYMLIVWRLVS